MTDDKVNDEVWQNMNPRAVFNMSATDTDKKPESDFL